MRRKAEFFIVATVLLSGVVLFVSESITAPAEPDYEGLTAQHDTDFIQNIGEYVSNVWWAQEWRYRTAVTVKEHRGQQHDAPAIPVVLTAKRSQVADDCSDIRVIDDGEPRPWIATTSCAIDTYRSDTDAVAHYRMNATENGWANDSSGFDHHGQLDGGPRWVTGRFDTGLQFDGTDDRATASSTDELSATDEITVMGWINTDEQLGDTERMEWAGKKDAYSLRNDERNDCSIGGAGPAFQALLDDGNRYGVGYCSAQPPDTGSWHHYVGVFDTDDRGLELWVDGELVDAQRNVTGLQINDNSNPVTLGGHIDDTHYFEGRMDDVRIYDTALEPGQIRGIHRNGIGLNISVPLQPQEQKQVFIYHGSTRSLHPVYMEDDMTALADPPVVQDIGPTRSRQELGTGAEDAVERFDRATGASIVYDQPEDSCGRIALQSDTSVLEQTICPLLRGITSEMAFAAYTQNDTAHWTAFDYRQNEWLLYHADSTSPGDDLVSDDGPAVGDPVMVRNDTYTIQTTNATWDNRPVESPVVLVRNIYPDRDWIFNWTDPDGTHEFFLPAVDDGEEDFLIFFEDRYNPFDEPDYVDDWRDHVLRVTFIPPDTYRVARYSAKGEYAHDPFVLVNTDDPLDGARPYRKNFGETMNTTVGGTYYEDAVYEITK